MPATHGVRLVAVVFEGEGEDVAWVGALLPTRTNPFTIRVPNPDTHRSRGGSREEQKREGYTYGEHGGKPGREEGTRKERGGGDDCGLLIVHFKGEVE
jgi:hypothetical protein